MDQSRIENIYARFRGSNNPIYIGRIITEAEKKGEISRQEVLELYITYYKSILEKTRNAGWLFGQINNLLHDETIPEEVRKYLTEKVDEMISDNFEQLIDFSISRSPYNYLTDFELFPLIQAKIKEQGKDILYRLYLPKDFSMDEIVEVMQKYFGEGTFEDALEYFFKRYEPEQSEICIEIAKELLKHTTNPEEQGVVGWLGEGNTNSAYQIGSYVLKLGTVKNISRADLFGKKTLNDLQMDIIPNSRYIVQPIIRQYIDRKISGYGENAIVPPIDQKVPNGYGDMAIRRNRHNSIYIEVQNLLDMDWQKEKNVDEIMDIIEKVFENLLSEDLLAYDLYSNIGRLRKANTSHIKFKDIVKNDDGSIQTNNEGGIVQEERELKPTQEGIRMTGEVSNQDCLQAGEYVLADTEYVEDLSTYDEETKKEKIKMARERLKELRKNLKEIERQEALSKIGDSTHEDR